MVADVIVPACLPTPRVSRIVSVRSWRAIIALFVLVEAPNVRAQDNAPDAGALEFFERRVRPILSDNCFSCHSAQSKSLKGGLRLDGRDTMIKGGDTGPAIEPGAPDKSLLIKAIGYKNVDLQMPPKGKLPDAAIADLTRWVKLGAPWPKLAAKSETENYAFDLEKRKREHWAWRPIIRPSVPVAGGSAESRNPIDAFLLAKLEAKGLAFSPQAEPLVLLRRLYYDLIGLPPTLAEIEAFVHDYQLAIENRQLAISRVVDRLLASPHFGERWGRHWLDLVRYAESRGHEYDADIANAWNYRDYVIRAFNADVPYNQFVTEQIAGDLLQKPRLHPVQGFNESILGTGFWFLGEELHSPVDIRADEADRLDNRIDVFSKTFLGLTVACARCHDHKFDAISTKDYYSLVGLYECGSYRQVRFDTLEHNRKVAEELAAVRVKQRKLVQKALAASLQRGVGTMREYLLAAHAVLQGGTDGDVVKAADARHLNGDALAKWVAEIRRAAEHPSDPLYHWAVTCGLAPAKPRAASWHGEIVLDYATSHSDDWRPDDASYGTGPARPGDLRFGRDPAEAIARFVEIAAAEFDPAFKGMRNAAESQLDSGALKYERAGRTIRTPTFTLNAGKLFYLVRGRGTAYAAVDLHTRIDGPLHGKLVRTFNTGDKWEWVAQDLPAYRGHRVHLEFTLQEDGPLAIARVAQGEQPPTMAEEPCQISAKASDPESLAKEYQELFTNLLDRLAGDRLVDDPKATELALLANWLIAHRALFGARRSESVTAAGRAALDAEAEVAAKLRLESRLAPAIQDGNGVDEQVFIRGSHKALGEKVPRRLLEALAGPDGIKASGSGRLDFAGQLTDPAVNPFINRVMVNRIWHHLFGRGIVASTDNFGVMGEPPTHPVLLDYLADQFARDGWSLKRLVRMLVLSHAYQQAGEGSSADQQAADPENVLLHKMRLRRLEGEAIRDAMLAVSGRLDPKQFGLPVPLHLTEFLEGRGRPSLNGPLDGDGRRSIYIAVRRNFLSPMMLAFDTPSPFSTVGRRTVSNVPAQALILMNDPFVHEQAGVWAKRVLAGPGDTEVRIRCMYLRAFARPPTDDELRECAEFVERECKSGKAEAAWTALAHVLFNVKEFIYVR
jgi:hypothetical protein